MTIPNYIAHEGTEIPQIGFGTYKLKGFSGVDSIQSALEVGYRYLDTAYNYENEATVGEAIRRSGIARENIQVASKLPGRYHHFDDALVTIQESLLRANLDYYDFYLIHWPNPKEDHYVEAWEALIEAQKRGYVKHLGVSNFLPEYIERIEKETGVLPVLNQVEMHPYFHQKEQRAYDASKGIITQSWSPFVRANEKISESVLDNEALIALGEKYGKTAGQAILRWQLQMGAMPIPKSAKRERQIENLDVFDFTLTDEDLQVFETLNKPDGRAANQDPSFYQEF
ncbi:aldo/keto reductase [Aerococcus sp. 1KP-2016]|uniref:aldo/keto reductase n=1 Tax=Aerococcus sp. 1KP-2016 TaxID=1981982 RepID=UPI000B98E143|nr:aldo/keto reductase [Aerococcus sp. 1KP-2016]OYQ67829.1 2,5-diketo-D-gluconic acid reductase [Aerococcus sp. 1KP-2016]